MLGSNQSWCKASALPLVLSLWSLPFTFEIRLGISGLEPRIATDMCESGEKRGHSLFPGKVLALSPDWELSHIVGTSAVPAHVGKAQHTDFICSWNNCYIYLCVPNAQGGWDAMRRGPGRPIIQAPGNMGARTRSTSCTVVLADQAQHRTLARAAYKFEFGKYEAVLVVFYREATEERNCQNRRDLSWKNFV